MKLLKVWSIFTFINLIVIYGYMRTSVSMWLTNGEQSEHT